MMRPWVWFWAAFVVCGGLLAAWKGATMREQSSVDGLEKGLLLSGEGSSSEPGGLGEAIPVSQSQGGGSPTPPTPPENPADSFAQARLAATKPPLLETATLGGGCFWCLEAVFQQLRGVRKVTSGYSGGHVKNPTYEQVCTDATGHAEVVQVVFDPQTISYEEILEVFFAVHDPTTLNRQGNDVGPQYRSVIFYHNDQQRQTALRVKDRLDHSGRYARPIVTQVVAFEAFYPAEDYHQNYFRRNPNQSYCRAIIAPKLEKFQKQFQKKIQPAGSETPLEPPSAKPSPPSKP